MNTVETRIRTTSTHPAVDPRFAAAARLAREATLRHTVAQTCRAVVDALSAPALHYEGIALFLDRRAAEENDYQVIAGTWPPAPQVESAAIISVPLLLDDARIGQLAVYRTDDVAFDEADAALIIGAAAHAALGVARAHLIQQLEDLGASPRTLAARKRSPRRRRSLARRPATGRAGAKKRGTAAASRRKKGVAARRPKGSASRSTRKKR